MKLRRPRRKRLAFCPACRHVQGVPYEVDWRGFGWYQCSCGNTFVVLP